MESVESAGAGGGGASSVPVGATEHPAISGATTTKVKTKSLRAANKERTTIDTPVRGGVYRYHCRDKYPAHAWKKTLL